MNLKGAELRPYSLMMKDVPVLDFLYDPDARRIAEVTAVRELDFAPLSIWNARAATIRDYSLVGAMNRWWAARGIPGSRQGIATALRAMGAESPRDLAEAACGLSLSDQYWIKPEGFDRSWHDVNFFENPFDETIGKLLAGGVAPDGGSSPFDPAAVSDGNLPKMWSIQDDGTRVLLKAGSGPVEQEPFNEAAATDLYRSTLSDGEYVPYDLVQGPAGIMSRCPCMVDADREFVPANHIRVSLAGGTGTFDIEEYLAASEALEIEGTQALLDRMLATDFLIGNWDRHGGNFGSIRNSDTREFERCAPLFDAGASLLCNVGDGEEHPIEAIPANPFMPRQHQQLALVRDLSWFDPEAAKRGVEGMMVILSMSPNRYMDARRLEFLRAFLESGLQTIELAAELPPAKNRAEVAERAERFRIHRNEALLKLVGTASFSVPSGSSDPAALGLPRVGASAPHDPARALETAEKIAEQQTPSHDAPAPSAKRSQR